MGVQFHTGVPSYELAWETSWPENGGKSTSVATDKNLWKSSETFTLSYTVSHLLVLDAKEDSVI